MSDFICKAVCWVLAAVIAFVAATVIRSLLTPGPILLFFMGLFVFIILAFALPMLFCKLPAPVAGADSAAAARTTAAATTAALKPAALAAAPVATGSSNWTDTVGASGKAGSSRGQTGWKPSAELADEATLRDGVGKWRYEGESGAPAAAAPETPAPAAEDDYDGDVVVEGTDEGVKPATLSEAREGGADDLKQIKGVGPKMEGLLNSLGFYHFDQVASWTDQEVAWVDANLEGVKGRVTRDEWVAEAKVLATGGET